MNQLNEIETAKYVAWDEYYNQVLRKLPYVKGRGSGPWGHKFETSFARIAKKCLQRQLDVRLYVETAIDLLHSSGKRTLLPKDLESSDLMARVLSLAKSPYAVADPATQWVNQIKHLQQLMLKMPDVYPDVITALMVPGNGFENWFRVLYIRPFNHELCTVYGATAYEELRVCRRLRDFLNKEVPGNMLELQKRTAGFGDM